MDLDGQARKALNRHREHEDETLERVNAELLDHYDKAKKRNREDAERD